MLAALRSFVAGAGLLLPAIVLRRTWPRGWRVWLGLLGTGLTVTSMGFGGMFLAGGLVSPGLATVLANVQPLIAAVLGFFLLRERLGPRRQVGLLLGFGGILLVALPGLGVNGANSSPAGIGLAYFRESGRMPASSMTCFSSIPPPNGACHFHGTPLSSRS